MAIDTPQNPLELIQHCLMRLGHPMIKVNVTDFQAKARVKEAIYLYLSYHFDATQVGYVKQEITQEIQLSKQIVVPKFVTGILKVLNMKQSMFKDVNSLGSSIYSVMNRNVLSNVETSSKLDIYLYEREISEWDSIWRAAPRFQFNRDTKILQIDTSSFQLQVGDFIMYQAALDVSEFSGDFFSNDWLIRYTSCLIKEQWGENLTKFKGIKLPGGNEYDVESIKNEAKEEKEKLRQELFDMASYYVNPISIG
jgi:hypothetical protein